MKASDIKDSEILDAIKMCRGLHGVPQWSSLSDIQKLLFNFPSKMVLAKLKSMVKRNILHGCTCGCRGDFEIV